MKNIKMAWQSNNRISKSHRDLEVKQVYCWVITKDSKILVVSKDGENWQLPGGKPNSANENIQSTVVREIEEETGLDLEYYKNSIEIFGYYIVSENQDTKDNIFLQIRTKISIYIDSDDLSLEPQEDESQDESDKIKYVKAVTINQLVSLIPWMKSTGEYKVISLDLLYE